MVRRSLILAILGVAAIAAQTLTTGRLLVATDKTSDPDFAKSVVLLIYADRDAALGLVINRPPQGGPVPLGVNTLLRAAAPGVKAKQILPNVFLVSDPHFTPTPATQSRLLRGTCGWTIHQLNEEIQAGKWKVIPGTAALVFDPKPETLWTRLRN